MTMEKLLWPALNLLGLLGFLVYKTKGPFFTFVTSRRIEIFNGLNKSKAQLEDAEKKRSEAELRISRLGVETAEIASEWKQKSLVQADAVRQSSIRVIAQMKSEAEQNKLALLDATRASIRASFRKAVLNSAEQKIIQALNPELHAKANQRVLAEIMKGESLA